MSDTEMMWAIVKEAIAEHNETSEKNLALQFSYVHKDLKKILDALDDNSKWQDRIRELENDNKIFKEWKKKVEEKPRQQLETTQKVVAIVVGVWTLLTGGALLAILKMFQAIGGKT